MLLGLYVRMQSWVSELRDERGASAVEYGLLVALIAAVIVVVVGILGHKVSNAFQSVNANMPP